MYWGGCDYNRGHVPLLPVSPFSINCNCYLFFIALYWYILCDANKSTVSGIWLNLVKCGGDRNEKNNTAFIAVNCNNKHLLCTFNTGNVGLCLTTNRKISMMDHTLLQKSRICCIKNLLLCSWCGAGNKVIITVIIQRNLDTVRNTDRFGQFEGSQFEFEYT